MNTESPALSVVIGIRNWGLDRLEVAIWSHLASSLRDIEIVISDYGSENRSAVHAIAQRYGCTYTYTHASAWSRSAALNAGIKIAKSNVILTTDGDILFAPKSHEILLSNVTAMPDSVQIIQCRDLPEGFGAENLSDFDWGKYFKVSSIRPRWGMGGSATFTKALFARIHGFDERMTVWGGEDNDFVHRARRSGALLNWVEDPEAQIYHIWHPPDSRGTSPGGTKIVQRNKKILNEDRTVVRNLSRSYRGSVRSVPTVSIVIVTQDRPDFLRESVASCLNQTFQDFEIVIVDDGSSADMTSALDDFDDDRVRLLRLEECKGVGFARNYATRISRGEFLAIHDDDDLMLPTRLEHQLGAIIDDCAGSYGGWIDFDDQSGALVPNPGRCTFDLASMLFTPTLVHESVLIRRQVLQHYQYDERFLGDPDHHLLNRIARAGVRLIHCDHHVVLRRLHSSHRVTASSIQHAANKISKVMVRGALSVDLERQYKNAAKDNPMANIPLSEVVDAAQLLPPRLKAKKIRVEFNPPLAVQHDELQIVASTLSSCQHLHIEFAAGAGKGIKALTIPDRDDEVRKALLSKFAQFGAIEQVREIELPLAYSDPLMLEAAITHKALGEEDHLRISHRLDGLVRILGTHCNQCYLSADGDLGYVVGLPPLQPPVQALLRAKLARFLTHSRQGEV